uniref:diaminopimelate epimerase n=1 Tax=Candidatus Enterococcus willemsii TaxID=1857215 RepID=UPI00403F9EE3
MENNHFVKTHALGNEYIVLNQDTLTFDLTEKAIQRICNINFGIGSDGILLKVPTDKADFGLRIFNPDGSEAEKSGNGLRIFCKYIYDYHFTSEKIFSVETVGGLVTAEIIETVNGKARLITVEMGQALFESAKIPTKFTDEEAISQQLLIDGQEIEVNCVSMGNPHCVVLKDTLDIAEIKKYGPMIENHPMFPNRINVQFAKVLARDEVEILIWERGAGFTLASGSSSCAVASVLFKKGLVDDKLTIHMQGGDLAIEISPDYHLKMQGETRQIAEGVLSEELLEDLNN